ncbi:hypothetical protein vBEclMUFV01_013 [Enterobacter phage vB_EclM-UFV01]|nr:hypothetical protein vBEclMUFV01_013 [Enterobacter phage vB_EclM-UFV01]
MTPIEIHFKHENGMSFIEIAREAGIKPEEAALYYAKVEAARARVKRREIIVYRKRLSNTDVESRHQQLVKHMRGFNESVS